MKDEWFRWEREASIHLLFPTLEGSMQPLKKFSGYGFPTTILIFKNGIVMWCLKEKEFYELGVKLLAIYKDKEQEMVSELRKRLNNLILVEEEINVVNVPSLTNKLLINLHYKLHDAFINYYGIGAIQEPVAIEAERELRKNKSLSDEQISSLIAPKKLSYIKEAENYLWSSKDIDGFIKQYYWIDNNYSGTRVLSQKDVEQRLSQIKPSKKSSTVKLNKIKLSNTDERLIELLKNFAIYQDERKKNILIYLNFLEILLKEIGSRVSIDLETMRNTFPSEIVDILNKKISKKIIQDRQQKCFVIWAEGNIKPQILTGKYTKEWEKKLLAKIDNNLQVKGKCASKGKVNGKVRILLNAKESNKLEVGEILVTFMTSPDFMSAIRKSSAIVTNFGGITSHAAIISRELGIPCIVGTKNATEILKTGDMVEVDADKGIVKILR